MAALKQSLFQTSSFPLGMMIFLIILYNVFSDEQVAFCFGLQVYFGFF